MLVFVASCIASVLSISTSLAVARNKWGWTITLGLITQCMWIMVELCIMLQLENPWTIAPCLVPAVVGVVSGVVGGRRYLADRSGTSKSLKI